MKRLEQMDHLLEVFGNAEEALEEITRALSDDEFDENYKFICRMHDIEEIDV